MSLSEDIIEHWIQELHDRGYRAEAITPAGADTVIVTDATLAQLTDAIGAVKVSDAYGAPLIVSHNSLMALQNFRFKEA